MNELEELEKLNVQLADAQAEMNFLTQQHKVPARQSSELMRKERTHRLCTRGGMPESCLIKPGLLTDAQIRETPDFAFRQPDAETFISSFITENEAAALAPGNLPP